LQQFLQVFTDAHSTVLKHCGALFRIKLEIRRAYIVTDHALRLTAKKNLQHLLGINLLIFHSSPEFFW